MGVKSENSKQGKLKSQTWLTLELEALGLRPIQEADGVIRIGDRPEDVLFLTGRVVCYDTSLQLGELVRSPPNPDENRRLLLHLGVVKNPLDAALAVLERGCEEEERTGGSHSAGGGVADAEVLDYVACLEEIAGLLVSFGAIMGDLESPYAQVTAFYNYWLGFSTVMDFCWVDQYDGFLLGVLEAMVAGHKTRKNVGSEQEVKESRSEIRVENDESDGVGFMEYDIRKSTRRNHGGRKERSKMNGEEAEMDPTQQISREKEESNGHDGSNLKESSAHSFAENESNANREGDDQS